MANKVIELLKFKSAANLNCFQWEAESRDRPKEISQNRMHSLNLRLPLETNFKFAADLNFKSFITLLKLAILT